MRLFNGFCAHLQGERCVRGTKWIGMSKTKLPLSNISSAFCASALFTFVVIYPASIFLAHSPDPPHLEGCGRDELADQKKIFKATVWEPCSFQLIWAGLLFSCFDANRVVGHRWLHNGEHTQCILGALPGHKWQWYQVCLKSRVHQQMVVVAEEGLWGSYLCVNSYNGGASAWKLLHGLVSIKPVL